MATQDSSNATPVPQMSPAELSALAKRVRNRAESIVLRDQPEMQRDMQTAAASQEGGISQGKCCVHRPFDMIRIKEALI
jgi:hypothetical protein